MKAIVENPVNFLNSDEKNHNMLCQFNEIIANIVDSVNEQGLKVMMKHSYRYFDYGFGSNHMWVNQKNIRTHHINEVRVDSGKRIIFVEF